MTYATYISQLRVQSGDDARPFHVDLAGDGTTTRFYLPADTFPILEGSYTVKIAGVAAVENTDYTLNKQTGLVTFLGTPPTVASIDGNAVYMLDATWLQIMNDVIRSLGKDFFKEATDETLTTTANMLSLAAPAGFTQVIDLYWRQSTNNDWTPVEELCNWRYSTDENKFYFGLITAFPNTGELLKVKGMKAYTLGAATSDTLDVQDQFLTVLEYGCLARFWRYRYKQVVELVSKLTTEPSRTPLQEMIMLSDRFDRSYEAERAKLKPMKPAKVISISLNGGGRP